jgi:transposase-like protein
MPKRYPEEFRRKVLDLVAAGRPIAQISTDLGLSDQTIYNWRRGHRPCGSRNSVHLMGFRGEDPVGRTGSVVRVDR